MRTEVIRELDEYEYLRRMADERSEIRELTQEEKYINELVFPDTL